MKMEIDFFLFVQVIIFWWWNSLFSDFLLPLLSEFYFIWPPGRVSSFICFFGVEDFLDDDNIRPCTYQKEKKSKNLNKHVSFKQSVVAYMEPFTLDVFISKRFVSASITHRVTNKQVAVVGTNSKYIKAVLKSRSDIPACLAVGRILADRAREANVYRASYTPRERETSSKEKLEQLFSPSLIVA
ncbi:L18 ribosomal Heart Stopper [Olea europaea subsp. europaea]|uniref:TPA_inf: L18 ribosomal Heart Stopper n=1 Tax=Olea europaea subsp. europaea TaxID=158383 RepID=A0A8S0PRM8_OLEEU|nr:L18 ribosomal Heart Stopper [Olea europaea subsp. europaea]